MFKKMSCHLFHRALFSFFLLLIWSHFRSNLFRNTENCKEIANIPVPVLYKINALWCLYARQREWFLSGFVDVLKLKSLSKWTCENLNNTSFQKAVLQFLLCINYCNLLSYSFNTYVCMYLSNDDLCICLNNNIYLVYITLQQSDEFSVTFFIFLQWPLEGNVELVVRQQPVALKVQK